MDPMIGHDDVRSIALDQHEATELITESWRLRAPKTLVKQFDADHR